MTQEIDGMLCVHVAFASLATGPLIGMDFSWRTPSISVKVVDARTCTVANQIWLVGVEP
jgi:hypothetical protein